MAKIPRDPMIISAAVGKDTTSVPLVIDANTRQALATFSQNYEENARRKVALKVRAEGYGIEPGDLFALTDIANGFDNEVFKCTATTHGANWVVDLEGEAILRCSIYGEEDEFVPGWDPTTAQNVTLDPINLTATNTSSSTNTTQGVRVASVFGKTSGKYYWEQTLTMIVNTGTNTLQHVGIGTTASTFGQMGLSSVNGNIMYFKGELWIPA